MARRRSSEGQKGGRWDTKLQQGEEQGRGIGKTSWRERCGKGEERGEEQEGGTRERTLGRGLRLEEQGRGTGEGNWGEELGRGTHQMLFRALHAKSDSCYDTFHTSMLLLLPTHVSGVA